MRIAVMTVRLHAPWVHSLKEKRMELKSLTTRIRSRFNVSVCEAGENDVHQILLLGVCAAAGDSGQGDSILDHVLDFIEENSQAQQLAVEREIL